MIFSWLAQAMTSGERSDLASARAKFNGIATRRDAGITMVSESKRSSSTPFGTVSRRLAGAAGLASTAAVLDSAAGGGGELFPHPPSAANIVAANGNAANLHGADND